MHHVFQVIMFKVWVWGLFGLVSLGGVCWLFVGRGGGGYPIIG